MDATSSPQQHVQPSGLQLSVIIATCNRVAQLERALDSLGRQSMQDESFEVIVVNNGPDNFLPGAVENHLRDHPHWKLLHQPKPGAAAARNKGIQVSRAPILLFLDDDIVADPQLIEEHLRFHQEHPGVAVLGVVRFPWKGDESPFFWCLRRHPELYQCFSFHDPLNVPFQYFYTCNLSLMKSFFSQAAAFDEGFTGSGFEDTELGYRFVKAGFRIIFNEKASALHDVCTNFRQFSEKRYATGRWARYFLEKYPEQRATFLGSSGVRTKISSFVGFLAIFARPLLDGKGWVSRSLLPVLGRLCWHHLQYCFRNGFQTQLQL